MASVMYVYQIFLSCILVDAVRNLQAISTSHSIKLSWVDPVNYSADGAFNNYLLMCSAEPITTKTKTTIQTTATTTGLSPYTEYSCCVTPQWSTNGAGPQDCIKVTTDQDGMC